MNELLRVACVVAAPIVVDVFVVIAVVDGGVVDLVVVAVTVAGVVVV